MVANYFLGSIILAYITNIVAGYVALKVVKFIYYRCIFYRFRYEVEIILGIVVFVSVFIFIDYIAVTMIFANREMMLESIIFTLAIIVISKAMIGGLAENGIRVVIIGYLYILFCAVCIWMEYNDIRFKSVYESNIVINETPVVTEERYEILGGNDTTRTSGYVTGGGLYYIHGSTDENSYYKIYYPMQNSIGEVEAVPMEVKENQTKIILLAEESKEGEYLLKKVYTYYREDRNKEPIEKEVYHQDIEYKLYVNPNTFNGMLLDGNK